MKEDVVPALKTILLANFKPGISSQGDIMQCSLVKEESTGNVMVVMWDAKALQLNTGSSWSENTAEKSSKNS